MAYNTLDTTQNADPTSVLAPATAASAPSSVPTTPTPAAEPTNPLRTFIANMQGKGVNTKDITDHLVKQGHTPDEITAAMPPPIESGQSSLTDERGVPLSMGQGNSQFGGNQIPQQSAQASLATRPGSWQRTAAGFALEYGVAPAVLLAMPESSVATLGAAGPYIRAGVSAGAAGLGVLGSRALDGRYTIDQSLRDAGIATLVDGTLNLALTPAVRALAGKLLTTGKAPTEAVQNTIDRLAEKGGSLTMGGVEGTSSRLATETENFLRGSFIGKGVFRRADALNKDALRTIYDDFISTVADSTDDVRFGRNLQSFMVGSPDPISGKVVRGGIADWVHDTAKALYTTSESFYEGKGLRVSSAGLEETLNKYADEPAFQKAISIIKPYLPESTEQEVTKVQINPATGTPFINPKTKQPMTFTRNEMVPGVDIPIEAGVALKKEMNNAISNSSLKSGEKEVLKGQVNRLSSSILTTLNDFDTAAGAAFHLADSFFATAMTTHEQAFSSAIVKKLGSNPTGVISYIESANNANDALVQLKRTWDFAESGFQGKVAGASIPSFEEGVMRPLRFDILNKAYNLETGAFELGGITSALRNYSESTKVALFGANYTERLEKIGSAAKYLADYKFSDKIMPAMVESGLLASTALGAVTGGGVSAAAGTTLSALLLVDATLSHMFTNPKLVDRMIRGINAGPADSGWTMAVYQLVSSGIADLNAMRKNNPKAANFYTADGFAKALQQKAANVAPQAPSIAPQPLL